MGVLYFHAFLHVFSGEALLLRGCDRDDVLRADRRAVHRVRARRGGARDRVCARAPFAPGRSARTARARANRLPKQLRTPSRYRLRSQKSSATVWRLQNYYSTHWDMITKSLEKFCVRYAPPAKCSVLTDPGARAPGAPAARRGLADVLQRAGRPARQMRMPFN